MKTLKITLIFSVLLLCFASNAGATSIGIGARSIAMGGAYSALANDITAAYWNPAGLVHSDLLVGDGMIDFGYDGNIPYTELLDAVQNPEDFMLGAKGKSYNINAYVNSIAGGSVAKIGVSLIPWGTVTFTKPGADGVPPDFPIDIDARLKTSLAVTVGSSIDSPFPVFSKLSVGANVKSISGQMYKAHADPPSGPTGPIQIITANGSAIGLDLGAQADITPFTTVGIVLRDVLQGFTWSGTKKDQQIDDNLQLTGPVTESAFSQTETGATGIIIGVAQEIPGIVLLSADIENRGENTDFRFGAERGLAGILFARGGYYTDQANETAHFTLGFGVKFIPGAFDIAFSQDVNVGENRAVVFSLLAAL